MVTPIASREVTTTTAVTRRRTRTRTHMIIGRNAGGTGGGRGRGRGNQARVRRGRGRIDGQNRHGRCNYCRSSTEHGWHDGPFASRTNKLMKLNMLVLHTLVPQRHLPLTLGDDHRERRFRELSGCRWQRSRIFLESR